MHFFWFDKSPELWYGGYSAFLRGLLCFFVRVWACFFAEIGWKMRYGEKDVKRMSETRTSSLLWEITVLVVICCCCLSAQAKYGGGSGEPNDPYQIRDANDMQAIGADANDWDKCFKLMADIDLSGYTGTEFNITGERYYDEGWVEHPFTGIFDGNDHTIVNFTWDSNDREHIGLFGYVDDPNAEIKNLGLIDPNVDAGAGLFVGALFGYLRDGIASNCYVEGGRVSGRYYVGGLVGENAAGTITSCYSMSSVSGRSFLGGLVGRNEEGTITNCYSGGSVKGSVTEGNSCIGGLVGCNYYLATIINSYSMSSVSGQNNVGAFVGHNHATINNCYSSGSVLGIKDVGGLVGDNDQEGTITNCYSLGNASGANGVGGLVGDNDQDGIITNCYSTGSVTGPNNVGGLVGYSEGTVDASFWDTETSGQTTSTGGTGKTTAEMQMQSTFEDWDFINVWNIGENQTYPYLRTYPAGDIDKDGIVNFKDLGFLALHWLEDYGAENKPPTVWITYPDDGARLMVGGVPPQTMIMAEANDYDGIVVRVEFFANDLKLGEDPDGSDGWNYLWQGYSLGWHVLTATAWDEEGLPGTSSPVNVEVWMPDPPPP